MYLVVLCPDFFSTQNPEKTDARQAFIPVQMLHFFDDGWNPWVPAIVGKRNPVTLRMEWTTDPRRKVRVNFFTRGEPYRVLRPVRDQHSPDRRRRSRPTHFPARLRPPRA
jgi:peptide/nickel transport system permease protein